MEGRHTWHSSRTTGRSARCRSRRHFPIRACRAKDAVGRLGRTYNRIGGLIDLLATRTSVETAAVLAVWSVDSGIVFIPGRPILRIELHKLFEHWGDTHVSTFDRHFRFGGHGIDGRPWQRHQWRRTQVTPFSPCTSTRRIANTKSLTSPPVSPNSRAPPCPRALVVRRFFGSNHAGIGYPQQQPFSRRSRRPNAGTVAASLISPTANRCSTRCATRTGRALRAATTARRTPWSTGSASKPPTTPRASLPRFRAKRRPMVPSLPISRSSISTARRRTL